FIACGQFRGERRGVGLDAVYAGTNLFRAFHRMQIHAVLPINRKSQTVDHLLRQVRVCAYLLDSIGTEQIPNSKRNGDRVRKFRYRLRALPEDRSLIRVNALEAVEEIAGVHASIDAETNAVRKRAVGFEKYAAIVIPNDFALLTFVVAFVFGLLRGSTGNHKKEKRERDQLVTNNLHTKWLFTTIGRTPMAARATSLFLPTNLAPLQVRREEI